MLDNLTIKRDPCPQPTVRFLLAFSSGCNRRALPITEVRLFGFDRVLAFAAKAILCNEMLRLPACLPEEMIVYQDHMRERKKERESCFVIKDAKYENCRLCQKRRSQESSMWFWYPFEDKKRPTRKPDSLWLSGRLSVKT